MSEAKGALEAFVVNNEDLDQLEALLAEFNIFEAVGVVRQELRTLISWPFCWTPSKTTA